MAVLVIGVRRRCYEAAAALGRDVLLWSDGPLPASRKRHLKGWLESPFEENALGLTDEVKRFLASHDISHVMAPTEASVILGARVRRALGLEAVGENVAERFHNKLTMKNAARDAGIPITAYALVEHGTTAEHLVSTLGLPLVLKPVDASGAFGVEVCRSVAEVEATMREGLLAEAFVAGTEVSVETFIHERSPLFHNCTEYLHQWKKSVVPAVLEPSLMRDILDVNDRVLSHFGIDRGVTHAEFYLTPNGPVFGEIAIRPPGGYYMELIERVYGFDPWRAFVELSCRETASALKHVPQGHAAVLVFHPEAGRLAAIDGEDEVRTKLKSILEFRLRCRPGDLVNPRQRTSNEVGHLLLWEATREDVLASIAFVEETLRFDMDPP